MWRVVRCEFTYIHDYRENGISKRKIDLSKASPKFATNDKDEVDEELRRKGKNQALAFSAAA